SRMKKSRLPFDSFPTVSRSGQALIVEAVRDDSELCVGLILKRQAELLRSCSLFCRNPVHLFFQVLFRETNAFQNALAVFDHIGVAAEISDRICSVKTPHIGILPQNVIDTAHFAGPFFIVPRPTYGRNIFQPRNFSSKLAELVTISKLPRLAGAIQDKKLVLALECAFLPIPVKSPHITYEWSDSRNSADQEMLRASTLLVEREQAFRGFTHEHLIANL